MKRDELAQWAELVASVAIIATLIVLVFEVQGNTAALERQAMLDRANAIGSPFFEDPRLASASAKVRAVDGANPVQSALSERYGLTDDEALVWARHLAVIWEGINADFEFFGDTPELRSYVNQLLMSEDVAFVWDYREGVPFERICCICGKCATRRGGIGHCRREKPDIRIGKRLPRLSSAHFWPI